MRINTFIAVCVVVLAADLRADDYPTEVPKGEIAGTVTDEAGQPIEGALVDAWTWYTGNETKTDKAGHFHLKGLRDDEVIELRISKAGMSPWYNRTQDSGVANLNVTLNDKTYFEGNILDADGKPLPNVLVRVDSGPKEYHNFTITDVWTETKSDANGHYKLFVAPDSYLFEVRVPEIGIFRERVEAPADQAVAQDVKLAPGIRLVVNCIDGDTNEPVPGVNVRFYRHRDMQATSDAKGQAVINNVMPGKFEVSVSSKSHVKWWSDNATDERQRTRNPNADEAWRPLQFELTPDMEPITINFERGVSVSGHIVDPDGNPVSGAVVVTARSGWDDSIDSTQRFTATTAADGSFSFILPVFDGVSCNLIAHDGAYGKWRKWANGVSEPLEMKRGEDVKDIALKLTVPATIKGKVVNRAGEPVSNKAVRVIATDSRDSRYVAPETKSDKDGNFELKFVRPGDVLVQVEPFYMRSSDGHMSAIDSTPVTIGENETKEDVTVTCTHP
jgi:protocatechuate 3,4-dioxygenase beta subunit